MENALHVMMNGHRSNIKTRKTEKPVAAHFLPTGSHRGGPASEWDPQEHLGLGPTVLHVLPKLPLGRALSYHKQEGSCIYVNNVEPWKSIKYLHYHGTDGLF